MTREHKLALIVGFSLVLIVGVLISDHLSPARTQDVSAGDMSAGTPVGFGSSNSGLTVPADPRSQPRPFDTLASQHGGTSTPSIPARLPEANPDPETSRPLELVMGDPRQSSQPIPDPLANDFEHATGFRGERFSPLPGSVNGEHAALVQSTDRPEAAPTIPGKPYSSGRATKYTVREGDSAFRIAATQYGDGSLWSRLRDFNRGKIGSEGELREGAVLELPPKDVLLGKAALPPPGVTPPAPASTPKLDPPQKRDGGPAYTTYVVQRGDELGLVAKKTLGSVKRWPEIAALNRDVLPDPDVLVTGTRLKIPAR